MRLTAADIIEAILDELVMGDLGASFDDISIERVSRGTLMLDYGDGGQFQLDVIELPK